MIPSYKVSLIICFPLSRHLSEAIDSGTTYTLCDANWGISVPNILQNSAWIYYLTMNSLW